MLMNDDEVTARLESPNNLINRMNALDRPSGVIKSNAMNLFGIKTDHEKVAVPTLPPSSDELIQDLESKIKFKTAKDSALDCLVNSLSLLKDNIHNVDKPEKLARIASEVGKTLDNIDTIESGRNDNEKSQVIIYRPVINNESYYETLQVGE